MSRPVDEHEFFDQIETLEQELAEAQQTIRRMLPFVQIAIDELNRDPYFPLELGTSEGAGPCHRGSGRAHGVA